MKVLVTIKLPEALLAQISKVHEVDMVKKDKPMSQEQLLARIKDKHGLLCTINNCIDGALLKRAPYLKVIASYGAGYDHIDLKAACRRSILVSNTPGAVTAATADTAMALILATARRLIENDRRNRAGQVSTGKLFHFLGFDVTGKKLGIIGMGRIGKAVTQRAKGFEMQVVYHSRNRLQLSQEQALGISYASFEAVLKQADFLSLHVPLTDATHHLIDHKALSLMKQNAILINTSRGSVVYEKALVSALHRKQIGGAGLDVYENEPSMAPGLSDLDNTVLLPHIGSATLETRTHMARMAVDNLLAGLSGQQLPNRLHCPPFS